MRRAFALAEKGRGRVSPNPLVGALVVRDRRRISQGYHAYFGGPHAESVALRRAGSRAEGATLYVTLEPCSSWGKTPPCVDRVITSGIRRVVISSLDPNPKNRRRGIQKLKQAGIEVLVGVLGNEAKRQNEAFFKVMTTGYPFVTLKMAQSLDGKIATRTGESRWISSHSSRRFVHQLRDEVDAVLVGKNTALRDDPRLEGQKRKEKPWRVVLDPDLEVSSKARLFRGPQLTFVAVSEKRLGGRRRGGGVEGRILVPVPEKNGSLELRALLKQLASLGVNHLLVEGGGEAAWSFIQGGWADRLIWMVAPKIIGGRSAKTSVEGEGVEKLTKAFPLKWEKAYPLGGDWVFEARLRTTRVRVD